MAAAMTNDRLVDLLQAAASLLAEAGEVGPARRLREFAICAAQAVDNEERQDVVHGVLSLYGGIGSFQDLVLQDERGVRPEQQSLDRLRGLIFQAARDELR